jgi:antimicrobial peptide system SdpA family protein
VTSDDNTVPVSRRLLRLIVLILVLVAAYDLQAFLPANVLRLPKQDQVSPNIRHFLPQGWAFFTKSARSPDVDIYAVAGPELRSIAAGAFAEPGNAFGLDRAVRARGTESAFLINGLKPADWRPCTGSAEACLAAAAAPVSIRNTYSKPTICGPVMLIRTEPVPWAYRDLTDGERRITDIARAQVAC